MPATEFERAERALAEIVRRDGRLSRRAVMRAAMLLGVAGTLPRFAVATTDEHAIGKTLDGYPFTLGVASGYPRPDGMTLWTRLAPKPLEPDGGMPRDMMFPVRVEVAADDRFRRIVRSEDLMAQASSAHAVHVDIRDGVEPGRWYWYRFHCLGETSPVGRTRTTDAVDAKVTKLRFAIASCQHFEQSYFTAYRHLVREDLDLMLFLGDYYYEVTWGENLVRRHVGGTAKTLDDFRVRNAQYKHDADLQRAHATFPWAMVWDDHEVENDWAGEQGERLDPQFLMHRAAAFQAYFEHMPMPRELRASIAAPRIRTTLQFGDLARFYLLDERTFRTPQACPDPKKGGGSTVVDAAACPALDEPSRTMLGAAQERWLDDALARSTTRWNLVAQQTLVAPADADAGEKHVVSTDAWDGYPAARARFVASLARVGAARNPVVLGGDLHATIVADLHRDPVDAATPIVASEFCGTSLAAQGWPAGAFDEKLRANPALKFADGTKRGYLAMTLTPRRLDVAVRNISSEKTPESTIATAATFSVEAGKPGVQRG